MTRIGATGSRVIPALEGVGGLGGQDNSPGVIGSVCDITDVDCTYLADGDVLQWNGYAWVPVPMSGGSANVPWSYAQADGGLVGDGVTDDTAAFQAWVNSVTASGAQSGWFWFEPGVYLISGALQDTGAFNGQIVLPSVSTSSPQITLTFEGAARPPFAYHGGSIDGSYAVIKTTLSGASGTAAVISGGNSQNNIQVVVRNLVCLAPDNPTFTFWNLKYTQGGRRDGLFISTTSVIAASGISQPTHSNAYGVKLPGDTNSNLTAEDVINVYGFYTGVLSGELTQAYFITSLCQVGIEIPATSHSGGFIRHQMTASPIGIKMSGTNYVDIWYDAEHANTGAGGPYNPAWAVTTYDLDDASNQLHGHVEWFGVQAGVGRDGLFTVNGGSNSSNREIGPITSAPSFATPAIVLGTAAAVGAASTVIRSDSTIVAFDTTVPVTQAFGDSASTGSSAHAARRDHVHGMPATPTGTAHYLVIASSHSTPLVFDDIVQSSGGDDFVYTS